MTDIQAKNRLDFESFLTNGLKNHLFKTIGKPEWYENYDSTIVSVKIDYQPFGSFIDEPHDIIICRFDYRNNKVEILMSFYNAHRADNVRIFLPIECRQDINQLTKQIWKHIHSNL